MNGIINLYKPPGITSHTAVAKVRRILQMKKVGHTGTLDPDAEGVLPICLGKGTKVSGMLTDTDKAYRAVIRFGVTTDTQDASGTVLTQRTPDVTQEHLLQIIPQFTGEIRQIPPMYSAVKVGGKKLYELARQGTEIERQPRTVTIFDLQLTEFHGETAVLEVSCSKGTYIRTLCHDLGQALGCGAVMEQLTRTRSGIFRLEDSVTLETLEQNPAAYIIPTDKLFEQYPAYMLSAKQERLVVNGVPIYAADAQLGQTYRVYGVSGNFLCLSVGVQNEDKRCLQLLKAFY